MIQNAIAKLLGGSDLSRDEARDVMDQVMRGDATPAQIAGFLISLRAKGETVDEIAGCAEAMRGHVLPVKPERADVIDTAGTGGDGAGTVNLSTAAALVAAAAGAGVAKHGNRAVSSACGSADVLEALGFDIELTPDEIARSIDSLGFGFLFAQAHHPAMKHAGPVRRELATRTVFNILGPLTNPASASRQVIGVFAPDLTETVAEALSGLGTKRAMVVHGAAGIDELSPAGPNLIYHVNGKIEREVLDPRDLGLAPCRAEDLSGGTPAENAEAIRQVFGGALGPKRDAMVLNAAAALMVAEIAEDMQGGVTLAGKAIDSGAVTDRLDSLVAFSQVERREAS
jgi:anthranilate phosphoribosyltransferase